MVDNDVWDDWPLILAYHSVSDERTDSLAVRVSDFEMQTAWLHRRGYRSMTLESFNAQTPRKGERVVIITFDDGYADNYTNALPVLKQFGFVATLFPVSNFVDTDKLFWWDEGQVAAERDRSLYRTLTWEQIREMAAYGIEIGSHTCTHPRLTSVSSEQCWDEITRSRAELEDKLGRPVVSFCYPAGDLNAEVITMVEKARYKCAVVTPPRNGIPLGRYTLRRIGVYHHNNPLLFRLKMMPFVRKNYGGLEWRPWKRLSNAKKDGP